MTCEQDTSTWECYEIEPETAENESEKVSQGK